MLLLLILAILGTPSFSAENYHGTPTGTHFCTSIPQGKNLTGVRIYVRNTVIMGIQVKHGDSWGEIYGSPIRTSTELQLQPDEHILGAYGTYRYFIQQIMLYTSMPREKLFGNLRGPFEFSEYPNNSNHVLRGFCGFYTRIGLRAIQFIWGNINGTCSV